MIKYGKSGKNTEGMKISLSATTTRATLSLIKSTKSSQDELDSSQKEGLD
ncbi:MAG: hypothetical protein RSD44_06925 [Akkermansia sp.]